MTKLASGSFPHPPTPTQLNEARVDGAKNRQALQKTLFVQNMQAGQLRQCIRAGTRLAWLGMDCER